MGLPVGYYYFPKTPVDYPSTVEYRCAFCTMTFVYPLLNTMQMVLDVDRHMRGIHPIAANVKRSYDNA